MPAFGIAIGFLGFSCFGPLTYWYFKYSYSKELTNFRSVEYLHLVFPIVGFMFIVYLENFFNEFYLGCSISLIIYLSYIFFKFLYRKKVQTILKLDKAIFVTMTLLFIVFLIQYFTPTIQWYVIGTAISSLIISGLFTYMLKYPPTLMKAISKTILKPEHIDAIVKALELEKLYHKHGISLAEFSKIIDIPKYIISTTIKEKYKKTFPEVINYMRIEEIKQKLRDPNTANNKIEALAFDVGFNSTSSFYTAFKKETTMTPREFQKRALLIDPEVL
ncbi:AraC family transcriptional regulator [uncultured Winogradskyella sp.]|uniref:helix-turn-helix domain-containing protein n=1 Tax=uncultured Winogradskyella sp. TaxID=395353 RepID=UPI002611D69F|nr:AraC family transcriptional regulator [uncultured Winogradskyella sp.]